MPMVFIIGAIASVIALFIVAIICARRVTALAKHGISKEAFIFLGVVAAFVVVFSVLSLVLIAGKTFNYEGGFSLKHAKEWRRIEQGIFNNTYSYSKTADEKSETLMISVSNLSKKAKRDISRDLRDSDKQLKLTAKATAKSEKEKAKQNEKQLKKSLKKDKAQLKTRLKENERALEQALQANEKRLKSGLEANRQELRKLSGKWLEKPSGVFTTLNGERLYTVIPSSNAALADLGVKPYGFFYGMVDGFAIPVQGIGAIFVASWQSYKANNNGASYLFGFIIGVIMLAVCLLLAIMGVHTAVTETIEEERKERKRREWEAKWAKMSEEERHEYRQKELEKKLESIELDYASLQKKNECNLLSKKKYYADYYEKYSHAKPERVLESFRAREDGFLDKVGIGFMNVFTAGGAGFDRAKEHYDELFDISKYYKKRYAVSAQKMKIANDEHNYIRQKALLYAEQLKEITEKLSVKQREIFDKSGAMVLKKESFGDREIQNTLQSIERFFSDYNIQAAQSFERTAKLAGNALFTSFAFVSNLASDALNKKSKNKDDSVDDLVIDMVIAGSVMAGAIITGGILLVVEGISQYAGNIAKNSEGVKRLKEGEVKILKNIDAIESNRTKIEAFTLRIQELNDAIAKSLEAYTHIYKEVSQYLYPAGDKSKTRDARKARKEREEMYFTQDEAKEIAKLGSTAKVMLKIIDADV